MSDIHNEEDNKLAFLARKFGSLFTSFRRKKGIIGEPSQIVEITGKTDQSIGQVTEDNMKRALDEATK